MIRLAKLAIMVVSMVAASAVASRADLDNRPLYEWVRSLRAVQDQIALGSTAAHLYQPKLIAEIAGRFAASDTKTLLEPRNVRAAISFTLSGGEPRILRTLLGFDAVPEKDRKLIKGVLAYAEGKYSRASAALADVDARTLDPSIAGQIALVQSILIYKSDPRRAIDYLENARLLSTGSLVEEAALRRQTVLVAHAGDLDRFVKLASQYFRRFNRSIYAGYFREQFSIGATSLDLGTDRKKLLAIAKTIDLLPEQERMATYLVLAETATFRGKQALAILAATNGGLLSAPNSPERTRFELYKASSQMGMLEVDQAGSVLKQIDRATLTERDAGLLDAALMVAADVQAPTAAEPVPPQSVTAAAGEPLSDQTAVAHAGTADSSSHSSDPAPAAVDEPRLPIATAALTAIASADKLLNGLAQ